MTDLTPAQLDKANRRFVTNEYSRRVERAQRIARRIAERADYLVRDLDGRAPDDMSKSLDLMSWAREIEEMAGDVRRLTGEADAIRDVARVALPVTPEV